MRLRHIFAFTAAGLLAACAPQDAEEAAEPMAEPAAEMSADEAANDQLRADYVTHYNMHHADMVADLFTDSAVFMSADQSINEGRAAIEAALTEQMAGSPTVDITGAGTMVFGDMAINRGTYSVSTTPEGGELTTFSGAYLSGTERTADGWKIVALITNYDAPPPEGSPLAEWPDEAPPDEGTMQDVVDIYVDRFNAGDAAGVTALFTDEAVFAYSNLPVAEGTAAIQAALEERFAMGGSPTLEIHDVGTWPLGEGWAVDAGWYRLTVEAESGQVAQVGNYVNLCQQQADGTWKIHWGISNGVPQPVM